MSTSDIDHLSASLVKIDYNANLKNSIIFKKS